MKRLKYIICMLLFCTISLSAQEKDESFEQTRARMLNDFKGFRKKVLDDYANYLDGVWKEFETFKGVKRNPEPKPVDVPKVDDVPTEPVTVPQPDKPEEPEPTPVAVTPPTPTTPPLPAVNNISFSLYGITWKAPALDVEHVNKGESKAYGDVWRKYQSGKAKNVAAQLKAIASTHGLSDWHTFQMVNSYVDATADKGNGTDRVALLHFLMANMGFDVRLACTEKQTLLLVPFRQMVYERTYVNMAGTRFYLFFDNKEGEMESQSLYSCELPADAECGDVMNLTCNRAMNIRSGDSKERTLTDGTITLKATVDSTLMEMLRHYPQMDVPEYAKSTILPELRKNLLVQMKPYVEGLPVAEAANKLIHFVQYAFDYATDGQQHGYEKAYFVEENFYYPKNDCEDRAIFYAWLVRNLLGLDVHLVRFPGHECTAVNFPDGTVSGDSYVYEGKRYTICDPTYIGARIGQCMPNYKNVKPVIELWY